MSHNVFLFFPFCSPGEHQHWRGSQLLGETHHCEWERHAAVRDSWHHHPSVGEGPKRYLLLLLQVPVTLTPDSRASLFVCHFTLCRGSRRRQIHFDCFRKGWWGRQLSPCLVSFYLCVGGGNREAAGAETDWDRDRNRGREMDAAVWPSPRQGHPLPPLQALTLKHQLPWWHS